VQERSRRWWTQVELHAQAAADAAEMRTALLAVVAAQAPQEAVARERGLRGPRGSAQGEGDGTAPRAGPGAATWQPGPSTVAAAAAAAAASPGALWWRCRGTGGSLARLPTPARAQHPGEAALPGRRRRPRDRCGGDAKAGEGGWGAMALLPALARALHPSAAAWPLASAQGRREGGSVCQLRLTAALSSLYSR
jgi:hypothetical protein